MMDLVEEEEPADISRRLLESDMAAGAQLAHSGPSCFRPGLQLRSMATRGILEVIEHFAVA